MTAPAGHYAAPDPGAVDAVAVLMRQVAEGTLTGAVMASRAAERCSEVFGQCDGSTDPLWPTHVEICRSVLGFGGLPAAELAQWLAVPRNRENPEAAALQPPAPDAPLCESYCATQTGVDRHDDADDDLADIPRDVLAEAEAAASAATGDSVRSATMKRTLLHRIAEALRSTDHDPPPAEPADEPDTVRPVEPLPPGQRRVKVSFDELLAARGYLYLHLRRRLAPPSDVDRARRAAEAAMGRAGKEVLWPD